jgi:hypothetical protein
VLSHSDIKFPYLNINVRKFKVVPVHIVKVQRKWRHSSTLSCYHHYVEVSRG